MTPKEQLAAARRFAGKKSKAQGDYFEALIEAGCNFYRDRKVADIEKTPEPMRPIKDLGGGKFIAHYTKAAQADFKGFLFGGQTVMFEAKHTDTGRMEQDRVTPDQAERLERAVEYGALAFVLCSFGYAGFYTKKSLWRPECEKRKLPCKYIEMQRRTAERTERVAATRRKNFTIIKGGRS